MKQFLAIVVLGLLCVACTESSLRSPFIAGDADTTGDANEDYEFIDDGDDDLDSESPDEYVDRDLGGDHDMGMEYAESDTIDIEAEACEPDLQPWEDCDPACNPYCCDENHDWVSGACLGKTNPSICKEWKCNEAHECVEKFRNEGDYCGSEAAQSFGLFYSCVAHAECVSGECQYWLNDETTRCSNHQICRENGHCSADGKECLDGEPITSAIQCSVIEECVMGRCSTEAECVPGYRDDGANCDVEDIYGTTHRGTCDNGICIY